jgi:threonine/homoserine/homoserine lactone efflux protein
MNISNPKVLLFFIAFFPQFAHLDQPGYQIRLLLLGFIFILVTLVVFSFIAWFSAMGSDKIIKNSRYGLVINYLAIFVFISVSVWFLFS